MTYKFRVDYTNDFKKDYKRLKRQGKDLNKIKDIVDKLAYGKELELKYKDTNYLTIKGLKIVENVTLSLIGYLCIG